MPNFTKGYPKYIFLNPHASRTSSPIHHRLTLVSRSRGAHVKMGYDHEGPPEYCRRLMKWIDPLVCTLTWFHRWRTLNLTRLLRHVVRGDEERRTWTHTDIRLRSKAKRATCTDICRSDNSSPRRGGCWFLKSPHHKPPHKWGRRDQPRSSVCTWGHGYKKTATMVKELLKEILKMPFRNSHCGLRLSISHA